MDVNADFSKRVVVHGDELEWLASPMTGVHRRMLDRIGDEVARATSIVRYAAGSHFSPHVHGGGEEFLVLEGVFQDEHGDFGRGSYVRNPPTSSHTPGSELGCTILVKLWQFEPGDRTPVMLDVNKMGRVRDPSHSGVSLTPLFEDERETVQFEGWEPHAVIARELPEGGEFFVVRGGFDDAGDSLRTHSWLRVPLGGRLRATAGSEGVEVWVKTRHLRFVEPPSPQR